MSKKRISENQRLIAFAMAASEGELVLAIDSLIAIRNSRFPKAAVAKATKRKVKVAVPKLPPTTSGNAADVVEPSSPNAA